jgi:hypothetical protein
MSLPVALAIYAAVIALLFLARKPLGIFTAAAGFLVATFVFLKLGFHPRMPSSVFKLYFGGSVLGVLIYATSSEVTRKEFLAPIIATLREPSRMPLRLFLFLLVPGLLAWQIYDASLPKAVAPPRIRSVHPAPPSTITFSPPEATEAKTIDVVTVENPLRKQTDEATKAKNVAHGKEVYYQNCFYCHGDKLSADGHYAAAMKPPPATFRDPGIIPLLTSSFLFWRVAKGGPGLPDEGTPWDSAMPVWEKFLPENDIWSALLFLSSETGYEPRANAAPEGGAK